jgi:hypothetical protein
MNIKSGRIDMVIQPSKSSIIAAILIILAYLATWRFGPIYGLILVLPDLIIIVYYISIFFTDIIYWIENRKDDKSFIPFFISFVALVVIFYLPPIYSNKCYPKGTYRLCGDVKNNCPCNLYREHFLAVSSFMATDQNAVYLTDLKNFRIYLGNYNEGRERIDITCNGDIITAIKTGNQYVWPHWTDPLVIDKKGFVLSELIKNRPFE